MFQRGANSIDDPFAVLGLARGFSIAAERVSVAQIRCLAKCHPDRQAEGVEREFAIAHSALINGAAALLRNPVTCAEALIALEDVGGAPVPLNSTQLIELLEHREAIEQIDEETTQRRTSLRSWIEDECATALESLSAMEESRGVDWMKARGAVAYLRALRRLSDELERLVDPRRLDSK